jgi:hypothetical protein
MTDSDIALASVPAGMILRAQACEGDDKQRIVVFEEFNLRRRLVRFVMNAPDDGSWNCHGNWLRGSSFFVTMFAYLRGTQIQSCEFES